MLKMFAKTTIGCFKNLIILESALCINRSFLLLNSTTKTICDFFYYFVYISVVIAASYETIVSPEVDFKILAFLVLSALELLALSIAARYSRKKYIAVEKLDSKFGLDDDYTESLKRKADLAAVVVFVSLMADVGGMMQFGLKPGLMMMFCVGSAAFDAEMNFISLFISILNIRLAKSINSHPSFGCTVYRHILIASAYFNDGFQFSILLMWLISLIKFIVFGFTLVFIYSEMTYLQIGFLIWHEIRSLYSWWVVCFEAYRTEAISKKLGFNLASKLVFDSNISNDSSSKAHQTLFRWYSSVTTQKMTFNAGEELPIGLYVPVTILDVSVNYLLLLIQFYMAYK